MIASHWEESQPLFISTSAMHRFLKKLKDLKPALRQLGKETMSDISLRTKDALTDLCTKQERTLQDPQEEWVREETEAYEKWKLLSNIEEQFLKQRSKLHLLQVGDQNNVFFYSIRQH